MEQYKRHNPNKLAVGTSRLSEEERRRAAERMYAAAEEHRKRRERADELYLMNIMKRTEAQVKALKGAPSAWATPRPGGGARKGRRLRMGRGMGDPAPPRPPLLQGEGEQAAATPLGAAVRRSSTAPRLRCRVQVQQRGDDNWGRINWPFRSPI